MKNKNFETNKDKEITYFTTPLDEIDDKTDDNFTSGISQNLTFREKIKKNKLWSKFRRFH